MQSKLVNWIGRNRRNLIEDLIKSVKLNDGPEQKLFDALIKHMKEREFATVDKPMRGISAEEAANEMQVEWIGSDDDKFYMRIGRLRGKIKAASSASPLCKGVYLDNKPYSIEISENPPGFGQKFTNRCIALLLADATDWFVGDVIKGINAACAGKYDLIIEVSNYLPKMEEKKIIQLSQKALGLLLVPAGDHALDAAVEALVKIPTVLIDRYLTNLPEIPCVHPDDKLAGRFAAKYLIESLKCERIIIVDQGSRAGGKFVISPLTDRADGCDDASGDVEVIRLPPAGTDERGGWKALQEFETPDQPILDSDGIFALTDRVAVGCRHYLATKHPEFDPRRLISTEGQQFGDFMRPPLVSIKFDNFEMGRRAAEILISEIEGKPAPNAPVPPRYRIGCTLLVPGEDPIQRNTVSLENATPQDERTA